MSCACSFSLWSNWIRLGQEFQFNLFTWLKQTRNRKEMVAFARCLYDGRNRIMSDASWMRNAKWHWYHRQQDNINDYWYEWDDTAVEFSSFASASCYWLWHSAPTKYSMDFKYYLTVGSRSAFILHVSRSEHRKGQDQQMQRMCILIVHAAWHGMNLCASLKPYIFGHRPLALV